MIEKDLTINELHDILTELIEKGFGDCEFRVSNNSDCAWTSIPKSVDPIIGFDYVMFTDYRPMTFKKKED